MKSPDLFNLIEYFDDYGDVEVAEATNLGNFPLKTKPSLFVLRPWNQLVSLPSRTRRLIYAPYFQEDLDGNFSTPMQHVINHIYNQDEKRYGEDKAARYRNSLFQKASDIMAAKGMFSLFDSRYEIFRVKEIVNEIYYETNEELHVHFFDGYRKIAERTYKVGQTVELLELWKPLPGQERLFSSVSDLYESTKNKDNTQITEVYLWSNVDTDSIPKALVHETVNHAVFNLNSSRKFRGIGVLFLCIEPEQVASIKFDQIEELGFQRCYSPEIRFAPGAMTGVDKNGVMIKYRDQIPSSPIWQITKQALHKIGYGERLEPHHSKPRLHMLQADHVKFEQTYVSVTFRCWDGTWAESAEVSGEYLNL